MAGWWMWHGRVDCEMVHIFVSCPVRSFNWMAQLNEKNENETPHKFSWVAVFWWLSNRESGPFDKKLKLYYTERIGIIFVRHDDDRTSWWLCNGSFPLELLVWLGNIWLYRFWLYFLFNYIYKDFEVIWTMEMSIETQFIKLVYSTFRI